MSQTTDGPVAYPYSSHASRREQSELNMPSTHNGDVVGTIGPVAPPVSPRAASPEAVTPDGRTIVTVRTPTHLSRVQILDATESCLQELGYDGTTIRRIAKQLDCAVGSIYRYFADKRALLAEVVQRRFEPVVERVEAGAPLDASAQLYAMTAAEQPELYRLMFWLSSIGQKTHANTLPAVIKRLIDQWERQIGDRRTAECYWAQVHGAVMQGRRADDVALSAMLAAKSTTPAPAPGNSAAPASNAAAVPQS